MRTLNIKTEMDFQQENILLIDYSIKSSCQHSDNGMWIMHTAESGTFFMKNHIPLIIFYPVKYWKYLWSSPSAWLRRSDPGALFIVNYNVDAKTRRSLLFLLLFVSALSSSCSTQLCHPPQKLLRCRCCKAMNFLFWWLLW